MEDLTITILDNGPLKVEGPCTVLDHEGQPVPVRDGKAVFLCRCGHSANKPFCDGAHNRIEFDGTLAPTE